MRELNSSFDYTSKDYKGYKQSMIDRLKVLMPEYTDLSETDAGIVIIELASVGLDVLSAYLDSQANESILTTAELWSSVLKWAKLLSYEPRFATSATIQQVFKLSKLSETDTIIPAGTVITTSNISNETPIYFETVSDLTIPAGKLGDEKDDDDNYLYIVDALEGTSIIGEVVGTSNNAKDQQFRLKYSPAVYSTIEVWCNDTKWTKAENNSFVNSESSSTNYTVTMNDLSEAIIMFGDGVFGAIPPKDKEIKVYYRVGGGTQGNVSPNTVTKLFESNTAINSTFNPYLPKVYGYDRESVKSVKLSAPALSRTTWGALTLKDFSDIVTSNFPEIKMSKSIRGDYAVTCGIETDTTCDDVVIGTVQSVPTTEFSALSEDLSSSIQSEFATRKLAGVNNIVLEPVTPVEQSSVTMSVSLLSDYASSADTVKANIKEAFMHYFDLGNVDIDSTLYVSDIEHYIMSNVSGINALHITSMKDYSGENSSSIVISLPQNTALKLFICKDSYTCNITVVTV